MKQTALRFGLFGAASVVIFGLVNCLVLGPSASWELAEVLGYLTILVSMIFVFFGIRHYRDRFNNGELTFGKGMKVGILIVLLPAIFFGLFSVLLTEVFDPEWADRYYEYQKQKIVTNTSAAEVLPKLQELEKNKAQFANPLYNFFLMAATVFVIGLIVTIISSITLRKTKFKNHSYV